jgi:hypothetical protein
MRTQLFDQRAALFQIEQFQGIRHWIAGGDHVEIRITDTRHDVGKRGGALQVVGHSGTDRNLESLVDGGTPEVKVGKQDALVGQLRLG